MVFYKDNGLTRMHGRTEKRSAWLLTERNPEIPAKVIDKAAFQ